MYLLLMKIFLNNGQWSWSFEDFFLRHRQHFFRSWKSCKNNIFFSKKKLKKRCCFLNLLFYLKFGWLQKKSNKLYSFISSNKKNIFAKQIIKICGLETSLKFRSFCNFFLKRVLFYKRRKKIKIACKNETFLKKCLKLFLKALKHFVAKPRWKKKFFVIFFPLLKNSSICPKSLILCCFFFSAPKISTGSYQLQKKIKQNISSIPNISQKNV